MMSQAKHIDGRPGAFLDIMMATFRWYTSSLLSSLQSDPARIFVSGTVVYGFLLSYSPAVLLRNLSLKNYLNSLDYYACMTANVWSQRSVIMLMLALFALWRPPNMHMYPIIPV